MKFRKDNEFFKKCKKCNEFHWVSESCPPLFFCEEMGNNHTEINLRAKNPQDAAQKYLIIINEMGDINCLLDNEIDIKITDRNGNEYKFVCSAYTRIEYNIQPV